MAFLLNGSVLNVAETEALVASLVDVVFDRAATDHEIEYFASRLLAGSATAEATVTGMLGMDGALYQTAIAPIAGLGGTALVAQAVQNAFGRAPTAQESTDWTAALTNGTLTTEAFVVELACSAEYLPNTFATSAPPPANTVQGQTGDDQDLNGSAGSDALFGEAGNDHIDGFEGSDLITGGTGRDTLRGWEGSDIYQWAPGDGQDTIWGNDTVATSTDVLRMVGVTPDQITLRPVGSEDFVVELDAGNKVRIQRQTRAEDGYGVEEVHLADGTVIVLTNRLDGSIIHKGSDGAMRHEGWNGSDVMYGRGGDDILVSFAGNDSVFGGLGQDTLYARSGDDVVDGGDGDDEIGGGAGADTIDGGDGVDRVTYISSNTAVSVSLIAGIGGGGDAEGDQIKNVENIYGSIYSDTLTGDDGANVIIGGTSSDGDDVLSGMGGNDLLVGFGGQDYLNGGSGADTLEGGFSSDTLVGGSGADVIDGGDGTDWVDYSASDAGVTVLFSGAAQGGDAEGDQLISIERFTGSEFADLLQGTGGNNVLRGNGGNDALVGGGGVDTLYGDLGNDTLVGSGGDRLEGGDGSDRYIVRAGDGALDFGASGYDVAQLAGSGGATLEVGFWVGVERVNGTSGQDSIVAIVSAENLVLSGNGGDDFLRGGTGDDTVIGGSGADTLWGGQGSDSMIGDGQDSLDGEGGADAYIFFQGDVIQDSGDAGFDIARLASGAGGVADLSGWSGLERINGNSGDDIMDASAFTTGLVLEGGNLGDDVLITGSGNDTIYGANGADALLGNGGNDALIGSNGADTLNGGTGNDFLNGGSGADVFEFEAGFGADVIVGFEDGTDVLDVSGYGGLAGIGDLQILQDGANTIARVVTAPSDQITFVGVSAVNISDADFIFL